LTHIRRRGIFITKLLNEIEKEDNMSKQSLRSFSILLVIMLLISIIPTIFATEKTDKKAEEKKEETAFVSAKLISDATMLNEPRADAAFVAGLMADTDVKVLQMGLSWCKIDAGLAQGYVASRFLRFSDVPEQESFAIVNAKNGRLTLREKPNTKSKALAKLKNGTVTAVLKVSDKNFTLVAVNGKEGYLLSNHLELTGPKESLGTGKIIHPDHPGKVRKIRMRWDDKTGSNVIDEYKTETPVVILSKGETWYEIEVLGKRGYMMKKYIEEAAAPAPAPAPAQPAVPAGVQQPVQPQQPGAVPTLVPTIPQPDTPFVPSPTATPDPDADYIGEDDELIPILDD
jgi:SH3-like domain-containing protein